MKKQGAGEDQAKRATLIHALTNDIRHPEPVNVRSDEGPELDAGQVENAAVLQYNALSANGEICALPGWRQQMAGTEHIELMRGFFRQAIA